MQVKVNVVFAAFLYFFRIQSRRIHNKYASSSSCDITYDKGYKMEDFDRTKPYEYTCGYNERKKYDCENIILCTPLTGNIFEEKNQLKSLVKQINKILRYAFFNAEKIVQFQMNDMISVLTKECNSCNSKTSEIIQHEFEALAKVVNKILGDSNQQSFDLIGGLIKKSNASLQKEDDAVMTKLYGDIEAYITQLINLGPVRFTPIVLDKINGLLPTVLKHVKEAQNALPSIGSDVFKKLLLETEKIMLSEKEATSLKILNALKTTSANIINLLRSEESVELKSIEDVFHKKVNHLLCEMNIFFVNLEREVKKVFKCMKVNQNNKQRDNINTKKLCKLCD